MKYIIASFIILFLCPPSFAQTVYTWTDNNGVLHLSDTPPALASNLESFDIIEDNPTTLDALDESMPPKAALSKENLYANTTSVARAPAHVKPQPLKITFESPKPDQTIRDNQGRIQISLQSSRKLSIDEKLQLVLNGETYGAPQTQKKWTLLNVDRGTHTFMIKALRNGKLIASTDTISVHLHRAKAN